MQSLPSMQVDMLDHMFQAKLKIVKFVGTAYDLHYELLDLGSSRVTFHEFVN